MPKNIIREYDNTSVGITEYANFSVVIPGFCGLTIYDTLPTVDNKYPCLVKHSDGTIHYYAKKVDAVDKDAVLVFNADGIYECSNYKYFVEYVGKKEGENVAIGSYAKLVMDGNDPKTVTTPDDFYNTYKGQVYTWEIIGTVAPDYYTLVVKNSAGYFKLTKATTFESGVSYVICLNGNEGNEPVDAYQNGNQIAFELLRMGYTVLYKLINKSSTVVSELSDSEYWSCLKDKSAYDFRYLCAGGVANPRINTCMYDVANYLNTEDLDDTNIYGRGDCIVLADINEDGFAQNTIIDDIKSYVNTKMSDLGKYAAICCPKVTYVDETAGYTNKTFPASFHYLACAAYAMNELNFNEWYAFAGKTRGLCDKKVKGTSFILGEIAVNTLQPRIKHINGIKKAVNVIKNIRGTYYFYGNRTALDLPDEKLKASHFLNIRQLCCTAKKVIWNACEDVKFNPNSDILWGEFCNKIKPTLEKMKANEGIKDYKFVKVIDDRKALMTAKIRIVPIEAVEDFDISLFLEDSISDVVVGEND